MFDLQTTLTNAAAQMRAERFKTSNQLTIGELILKLEAIELKKDNEEQTVRFDFEYLHPTGLHSWRGSYAEIAFGFSEEGEQPKVSTVIDWLKEAIGKTFEGYKGGDYVMGKNTPVWVANYSNCGDTGVVDIRDEEYEIVIETMKCKF